MHTHTTRSPHIRAIVLQQLSPEYEKLAKAMSGMVSIGAIDCDEHKATAGNYGVRGFPTLKVGAACLG